MAHLSSEPPASIAIAIGGEGRDESEATARVIWKRSLSDIPKETKISVKDLTDAILQAVEQTDPRLQPAAFVRAVCTKVRMALGKILANANQRQDDDGQVGLKDAFF